MASPAEPLAPVEAAVPSPAKPALDLQAGPLRAVARAAAARWRSARRRRSPASIGLAIGAALLLVSLLRTIYGWLSNLGGSGDAALDPESLSVASMLRVFADTKEYLAASGWHLERGTFKPAKPPRLKRVASLSRPGFRRYFARVSRKRACGAGKVQELHHISMVMPGVNSTYVMEVMVNPEYGVKWNPSVRKVVLRHQRRVRREALLREAFPPEVVESRSSASALVNDMGDVFDVTAQVTEMPVPRLISRVTGPRYTADFIAARFDCEARRGFTLATSLGTEDIAMAAGVQKGQELCMSAVMAAPVLEGPAAGGTVVHIVTHFDPQVMSKSLRRVVHAGVGRSLREMLRAIHKKARSVQSKGRHPYLDCREA
mmetsp:Transcript_71307/g.157729  ORF Transcript_71307/g.157729 Transcript_71307/m.157729 type:complete len:373 (+) Transcript_71307:2-1120(+)